MDIVSGTEHQKVLIVDRDSSIKKVLSRILVKDGYITSTASNSVEAMKLLQHEPFHFVITDVQLTSGEGIDLLSRLRMLFPEIITIVITSQMEFESAVQAIRLGASGFLLKPFRVDEIRLAMQTALENRSLQIERQRERILTNLVEAGKEIASSLDMNTLSQKVVKFARRVTSADSASFLLYQPEEDNLLLMALEGFKSDIRPGLKISLDESISGWALRRCFALNLKNDEVLAPELQNLLNRTNEVLSGICMPIYLEGKPLGVINVSRYRGNGASCFTSSDNDFLSILSSQVSVCAKNCELFNQVQNLYHGSIQALSSALQAKDTYTGGHSERVAQFTVILAKHLGLPIPIQRELWTAGILHDIGKIGTPEDILNKPTILNQSETDIIKNHPVIGAEIVRSIPALKHIAPIILHHHEWYDGNGYPDGISGEDIPLGARIISVADALEAMTSSRPYRKNRDKKTIIQELRRCAGTQFDPRIALLAVDLIMDSEIKI